jgi:hypothetical protein
MDERDGRPRSARGGYGFEVPQPGSAQASGVGPQPERAPATAPASRDAAPTLGATGEEPPAEEQPASREPQAARTEPPEAAPAEAPRAAPAGSPRPQTMGTAQAAAELAQVAAPPDRPDQVDSDIADDGPDIGDGSMDRWDPVDRHFPSAIQTGTSAPPSDSFAYGSGDDGSGLHGMARKLLAVGIVVLLIAGTMVFWFARNGGAGVALAVDLHRGQTTGYLMNMTMDATITVAGQSESFSGSVNAKVGWKVLSVDADGVATVRLTVSNMSGSVDGRSVKEKDPVSVKVKISRDGRILSGTDLSALTGENQSLPGGSQFMPVLPDHPVKPGDSWSEAYEQANPFGTGTIGISATGRLVNFETDGGHRVAVIQNKEKVPLDLTIDMADLAKQFHLSGVPSGVKITYAGSIDVTGYSWVDTVTKEMLKSTSDARFHLDMSFEGAGPQIPNGSTVTFDGSMGLAMTQARAPSGLSV